MVCEDDQTASFHVRLLVSEGNLFQLSVLSMSTVAELLLHISIA